MASLHLAAHLTVMLGRFPFEDAVKAFNTTRAGKSEDGKGVIKAIISGPDVSPSDY